MFSFLKIHKSQDEITEPEQKLTVRERALKVFSKIKGLDDTKEMMLRALESSERTHTLYMTKGSKIMPPVELNKALNGGCIGQVIESKSDKFKVGEYVKANFGWREYWISQETDSNGKKYYYKSQS
jgi:NADPH-dependent curcumin reductase CurA